MVIIKPKQIIFLGIIIETMHKLLKATATSTSLYLVLFFSFSISKPKYSNVIHILKHWSTSCVLLSSV